MKENMLTNLITFNNSDTHDDNIKDQYLNDLNINSNNTNIVDLNTIIYNAKNDRRFHKLLGLCIKYDIHIFDKNNNNCILVNIDNLILQSENKQKKIIKDLADNISNLYNIGTVNGWFVEIENTYIKYKKKIKDIDIIIYILKNIYNNGILKKLCCISDVESEKILKIKDKNFKNEKPDKYIAIYSNN